MKQEKSPKSRGSHKHGHSPSLSTKSVGLKWKGVHTEDTHTINSTLPISSRAFDGFCSSTGSHSDVTELSSLPPSPRPPWVLVHLDNGKLHLKKVAISNFPGHPVAGPSNLTPSIPSLAGVSPHVQHLAHWHVHIWAILFPPDY